MAYLLIHQQKEPIDSCYYISTIEAAKTSFTERTVTESNPRRLGKYDCTIQKSFLKKHRLYPHLPPGV